jgi:hypothetical protein
VPDFGTSGRLISTCKILRQLAQETMVLAFELSVGQKQVFCTGMKDLRGR